MKTIRIDGVIGTGKDEISSAMVRAMLPENGTDEIVVKIHSEGGSVFEGFAIFDLFRNYGGKKTAVVESSAFSIASFIPMAFDEVEIAPNGFLMLHNPYMQIEGDDEDLEKNAALLKQLKTNMVNAYATRSGKTTAEITAILKEETYLNATEAVAQGFCDRVTAEPVRGRVFAQLKNMPHGVVAALFGADSDGDTKPKSGDRKMSVTKTPATVRQIKSAFPKAKSDFVIRCMEKDMELEDVAAEYTEELLEENETLSAKVKAMEDELEALKACKAEEEEEKAKAKAEAEEEEEAKAKARRHGVPPIGKTGSAGGGVSAKSKWNEAVEGFVSKGYSKQRAVVLANQANPGLRQQLVAEVNA
jgi:ATP-dependent Clp protease protease subunit